MGKGVRFWKISVSLGLSAALLCQGVFGGTLWRMRQNPAAAAAMTVSLQSVTLTDAELEAAGYQVTLPVLVSGICCYVDCGFQLGEAEFVAANGTEGLCYAVESEGSVWMSVASSDNLDAGEIATLTLQLPADAQAGDVYTVEVLRKDASGTACTYGWRNENGKVETGSYTCVSGTILIEKGTAVPTTTAETTSTTLPVTTTSTTTTRTTQTETTFASTSTASTASTARTTAAVTTTLPKTSTHTSTATTASLQSETTNTTGSSASASTTRSSTAATSTTVATTAPSGTDSTGMVTTTETEEGLYGDVNLDQAVNLSDAVLLSKACADMVTLSALAWHNGDCNADGVTDGLDMIVLLQFLVNILDELPYEA